MTIDARPRPIADLARLFLKVGGIGFVFVLGVSVGASGGGANARSTVSMTATQAAKLAPLGVATPDTTTSSDDASASAPPSVDYLTLKVAAEARLKSIVPDSHGLRYTDVETRLSGMDGGGVVAFCGRVNGRSSLGGYAGPRRFIASQSVATTEDTMTPSDFEQAWARFCIDGLEGPKVWY